MSSSMVQVKKTAGKITEPVEAQKAILGNENETAVKLVAEILAGRIAEIRPKLDFASESGFSYPAVEELLEVDGGEAVSILESLVDKDILRREFFDRILRCPNCRSINLRPTTHCPKCGSGNIARGRVLEHFTCKYVGPEDEFIDKGKYICPRCKVELHAIGSDYQSQGIQRKCQHCGEIFNIPSIKYRCLKCSALTTEDKIIEANIYSYSLNEAKRGWLEFQLKPKRQLIEFLKERGYEVTENARLKGRSGAEHAIDILATRDDGVITYRIAIGVKVAGDEIGLGEIFDFDDKAYDIGIHDKVLVVVPGLGKEAETFASQQRIKVLEVRDLETVLASRFPRLGVETKGHPFEFKSKSQLIRYLKQHAYDVTENAAVKGRSGAAHNIDILATKDDGIVTHHIAIGIKAGKRPLPLSKIFDFDSKAYDIGIQDKVFIAVPGLTREAKRFAERQRIRVFEVSDLEPPG